MIDPNSLAESLVSAGKLSGSTFSMARLLGHMINARLIHEQVMIKARNMLNRGRKTCEENKFFDPKEQPGGCQQCLRCAQKMMKAYEAYRYDLDEAISHHAEENAPNEVCKELDGNRVPGRQVVPCVTCHRLSGSPTDGMCLDCWRDHNGDNEINQRD